LRKTGFLACLNKKVQINYHVQKYSWVLLGVAGTAPQKLIYPKAANFTPCHFAADGETT